MKICVTLVGVCRPSITQVKENIEKNMLFFKTTYPQHSFTYIVVTYKNDFYEELKEFCNGLLVQCHGIPQIQESDFIFPTRIFNPNVYRLFYSMGHTMSLVRNEYDAILRIRLDAEVCSFQIHAVIEENTYYVHKESNTSIGDNLAYGSYKVMKQVWKHENCLLRGQGAEDVLYSAVKKYGYRTKEFRFHYKLYQSSDTLFDGLPQWSKRSREWIYDGKEYTRRDL
jgi:hypothetical protein